MSSQNPTTISDPPPRYSSTTSESKSLQQVTSQPEQAHLTISTGTNQATVPRRSKNARFDMSSPVTPLQNLDREPATIDCPFCHRMTMTKVDRKNSSWTILLGFGICFVGGLCLSCVPCCIHTLPNCDHYCSACDTLVAKKRYDKPVEIITAPQLVSSKYAGTTPTTSAHI